MDLQTFIAQTLTQITNGVDIANEINGNNRFLLNHQFYNDHGKQVGGQTVKFQVQLDVTKQTSVGGDIGSKIGVLGVNLDVSGKVDNLNNSKQNHTIEFSVFIKAQ